MKIEIYSEICCEECNDVIHNHMTCPECQKDAGCDVYGLFSDIFNESEYLEIKCENCGAMYKSTMTLGEINKNNIDIYNDVEWIKI
jgi:C4-type Zn-finger protein